MTDQEHALAEMQDYSITGMTIQRSVLDVVRRHPSRGHPPMIRWGDRLVRTSDCIDVPRRGRVRIEFLSGDASIKQGVDIAVNGGIRLSDGTSLKVLRTWRDPQFEDAVEYPYDSPDGQMRIWNVYEVTYASGAKQTSKWTENAGFWVEIESLHSRLYHCSAGPCVSPDFDSLRFRLEIREL